MVNAARTLGMSMTQSIFKVILPRVVNGIAAGSLLVALYTLSDFGTPAMMRLDTFTRVIYVEYNAFALGRAAMLSLQLSNARAQIVNLHPIQQRTQTFCHSF